MPRGSKEPLSNYDGIILEPPKRERNPSPTAAKRIK